MKFIFVILTFSFLNFSAIAQEEEAPPAKEATQADWFSPGCPTCPKLLIPGSANLGNSKGVFRPGEKAKLKKKKAGVSK